MKSIHPIVLALVVACLPSLGLSAAPEKLALPDLHGRPDRWPAEVTITRELNFGGAKLAAGQKVKVIEYNGGSEIGVDAGNGDLYAVDPKDCDFLDAANAVWAKLTPAQRDLEPKMVIDDASLWPAKVMCTSGFRLNSGKDIPPGGEFELMNIAPGGMVTLWEPEGKAKLTAQLNQTDVVARARELVAIDPAKRPSRVANALKGKVVGADGNPMSDEKLDGSTVFALYYGASWCGPCRQFSPTLVKYINEIAADNPKLTVVLLSNDEKDPDMLKYMKDEKMPWGAVPMKSMTESPVLFGYLGGGIPQLTVVDRYGKIIGGSNTQGGAAGTRAGIAAIQKLVQSGVTR